MEELVGSFIADEDGTLRPNLDDEAMAQREKMKYPQQSGHEEVINDGERGTQIPDPGQDRDNL